MKVIFEKLLMAIVVIITVASCQKQESILDFSGKNMSKDNVCVTSKDKGPTRGTDPSSVINSIANAYNLVYDFNNMYVCSSTNNSNATVGIWVVPSKWIDYEYLVIVLNSYANVIGFYDMQLTDYQYLNSKTSTYSYVVSVACENDWILMGSIVFDIPGGYPDRLYVNSCSVPQDYSYPMFDNVTNGYVTLEDYTVPFDNPNMQPEKIVAKAASTFYIHFCGTN